MINFLGIILLILGLILGGLLPVFDQKYLRSFYGGSGLITQSIVFLMALLPVAIFIVTSTGSKLGIGLVMGFEFLTSFSMLKDRANHQLFSKKYLFQLARKLTSREIQILVAVQLLSTIFLLTLAIT